MPIFETHVTVECPRAQAFDFLLQPANVAAISPPEMGLHFVEAPEVIDIGSRIEFKVQGFGQVQTMVHEITTLVRPDRFVEQQVRGLFKLWIHEHLFEEIDAGRTKITDRIEFQRPGGVMGLLVTEHRIFEQLEDAFEYRHHQLQKQLGITR
jgi:ligand-binding SRPBCC domain-containing protein